ncbi:CLAVATA3/ESR-RELATED 13 [Perilla frutescens var. hirtella]|uniref:CLAVATA3/ESR-RELATED 13 n=1 Tax=Perilla frutescens var. hirtella TaxID=608512 RepID=A0AAD4PD41_PERFH|nr:CLAVATA3/ESR-RELATED 13 [Perilla frutescens var. hirtella]
MKIPLLLYSFCFSLLLFLLLSHDFYHFKCLETATPAESSSSSSASTPHRKALASTKFDFTPFLVRHRRERLPPGGRSQIDPRYGVEKRLVPTGPNPLHH